jgi:hypothetical protein
VPRLPLAGARDEPVTRFYLFTLKGYAYLSLRLGDDTEARDALALLRHLDPDDRVGGALVEAVRQRALVGTIRTRTPQCSAGLRRRGLGPAGPRPPGRTLRHRPEATPP